jgi:Ca2+-binding EF-hand superfamily protein
MVNIIFILIFTLIYLLGNGSVDFDEFLTMMRKRQSSGEGDTELQQVFSVNYFNN